MNHKGREDHEGSRLYIEAVARNVIDAGLKVHKALGPGLLESAYEHCLAYELQARNLMVAGQCSQPIHYDGNKLDAGYRLLLVEDSIVVEIKAVDALMRIHEALPSPIGASHRLLDEFHCYAV